MMMVCIPNSFYPVKSVQTLSLFLEYLECLQRTEEEKGVAVF